MVSQQLVSELCEWGRGLRARVLVRASRARSCLSPARSHSARGHRTWTAAGDAAAATATDGVFALVCCCSSISRFHGAAAELAPAERVLADGARQEELVRAEAAHRARAALRYAHSRTGSEGSCARWWMQMFRSSEAQTVQKHSVLRVGEEGGRERERENERESYKKETAKRGAPRIAPMPRIRNSRL